MFQFRQIGCVMLFIAGCGGGASSVSVGCDSNADCKGVCLEDFPNGGLCTLECTSSSDCPADTICADTESESGGVCLFTCTNTDDCREQVGAGYVCDEESDMAGNDIVVCVD